MAVRATGLKNFKGDDYITRPELEAAIGGEIPEGGLIDQTTGNLRHDLNPIHITSMKHYEASGPNSDDKTDQDFHTVKFIGNCDVQYNDDGTITIRIGDNLNSSTFNTQDGISNAKFSGSKPNATNIPTSTPSATLSNGASGANGSTAYSTFQTGDSITVKTAQLTAATADGATDGTNGYSVHFDDNENGKFKVYINKAGVTETYVVGAITGNGTFYGKLDGEGSDVTGIACAVTNWGTEAKSTKGATGYMANVNFTLTPASIYSDSTTFQVVKIEMYEGNTKKTTWTADSAVNGTYMYIKETTVPGTPTSANYTIVNPEYQWISGIKFLVKTNASITATAEGMKNIGYPASVGTKATISPNSGNAWFANTPDGDTGNFTTWTAVQDVTMNYSKSGIAINNGKFDNPQVVVKGQNINGAGSTATSAKTNNALLVCDENYFVTSGHGSMTFTHPNRVGLAGYEFMTTWTNEQGNNNAGRRNTNSLNCDSDSSSQYFHDGTWYEVEVGAGEWEKVQCEAGEGWCSADLQLYDGCVFYPKDDFTAYNKDNGTVVNRNYSNMSYTGYRYYMCGEVTKPGYVGQIASGTLSLTTDIDPLQYIENKSLVINIYNYDDVIGYSPWVVGQRLLLGTEGIATSFGSWSNGVRNINFQFKNSARYASQYEYNGDILGGVYVYILMNANCPVKIKDIASI